MQGSSEAPWVVTAAEKSKYDAMFKTADKDNDNLVTGTVFHVSVTVFPW